MLAVFGIESDGINLAINLVALFLVVIWIALVYWTWSDARRRIADRLLITCATLASVIFPAVGTIVYAIVRPPEYLDDVYEREASIDASETLVRVLGEVLETQRQLSASIGRLEQQVGVPRRRTPGREQQTVEQRTAFE
jgi:hypothetical protein